MTKKKTPKKSTSQKDFFAYIEDDKTKVIDITEKQNFVEMRNLCNECGLTVIGVFADSTETGADTWAKHLRSRLGE